MDGWGCTHPPTNALRPYLNWKSAQEVYRKAIKTASDADSDPDGQDDEFVSFHIKIPFKPSRTASSNSICAARTRAWA